MLRTYIAWMLSAALLIVSQMVWAQTGDLFAVSSSGTVGSVQVRICLNGKGPTSCENHTISNLTLSINTTIPGHTYPQIGIKVFASGYSFTGCAMYSNGYCIFTASDTSAGSVTVIPAPGTTTLSVSTSSLLLAASGNSRVINITNIGGTYSAVNVNYSISPSLPSGTSISPANCGTIAPGGICTLTITPGSTPSTTPVSPTGTAPTPSVISVSGGNTNTVTTDISILTYGNILQNGLIFSMDDTAPNTQSISGKVVEQKPGSETTINWTSVANNSIDGAASLDNGVANTDAIVADSDCTANTSQCAAQYCRDIGSEWYLPALNELSAVYNGLCNSLTFTCNFGGFVGNYYWSSSNFAGFQARIVLFTDGTSAVASRTGSLYKRCIRDF